LVKALPPSLARRCRFRAELHVPLVAGRARIGWLRPELAARLADWPKVFQSSAEAVRLLDHGGLDPVVQELAREGFIPGWRNERYRIAGLFDIERAAARPFGLATQAVHVNATVGEAMWIARRSPSKPTDPGMLDNLVGGGIGATLSVYETLVKEAWEEAGIPALLARRASAGGTVELLREVAEGVQSELIHVYDLELPADFAPANQDGEVAEFRLVPLAEARRLIDETDELTVDAALVALDYFNRRSALPGSASAAAGRAT
jgi:8-oxo-dGTP pyrophosphatase MutT (NUDIX family)